MLTHKGRSADSGHYVSWVKQVQHIASTSPLGRDATNLQPQCQVSPVLLVWDAAACRCAGPSSAGIAASGHSTHRQPLCRIPPALKPALKSERLSAQPDGKWIQFDDQEMIVRKEEEVLGLSGGGDWHMAYLLVYKARLAEA